MEKKTHIEVDYEPYGDEWKKELKGTDIDFVIDLLKTSAIKRDALEAENANKEIFYTRQRKLNLKEIKKRGAKIQELVTENAELKEALIDAVEVDQNVDVVEKSTIDLYKSLRPA